MTTTQALSRNAVLAVVVSALGYFVDIYDLLLFTIVRVPSLKDLGVTQPDALLAVGGRILDAQMAGMLLGGVLWGVLGDKRGRLSVLFGSIALYSAANIANGLVPDATWYTVLRFIAGVGLAGELGAGITLVSELLSPQQRGFGTTIVASFGILGAVAAVGISSLVPWRTAYFIGGGMGLLLLLFRVGTLESSHFANAKAAGVERGSVWGLVKTKDRAVRYLALVCVGMPIWYAVGVLVAFSKELGEAMGLTEPLAPARAVLWMYVGLSLGDLASGLVSQRLRSRKRALLIFLLFTCGSMAALFLVGGHSATAYAGCCLAIGISTGYWAVFVTMAGEQFGTNLRATAATTTPNVVRGTVPLFGLIVREWLKPQLGFEKATMVGAGGVMLLALLALTRLQETYGKPLDYVDA